MFNELTQKVLEHVANDICFHLAVVGSVDGSVDHLLMTLYYDELCHVTCDRMN